MIIYVLKRILQIYKTFLPNYKKPQFYLTACSCSVKKGRYGKGVKDMENTFLRTLTTSLNVFGVSKNQISMKKMGQKFLICQDPLPTTFSLAVKSQFFDDFPKKLSISSSFMETSQLWSDHSTDHR